MLTRTQSSLLFRTVVRFCLRQATRMGQQCPFGIVMSCHGGADRRSTALETSPPFADVEHGQLYSGSCRSRVGPGDAWLTGSGRIQHTASARFSVVQMQKRLTNVVSADRTESRAGAARRSGPLTRRDQPKHTQVWAGDGSLSPAPEPVRRRGLARIRSGEFAMAS